MDWRELARYVTIVSVVVLVLAFLYLGILSILEDRKRKKEWADHVARGFKKLEDRRKAIFEAEREERKKYDDRKHWR